MVLIFLFDISLVFLTLYNGMVVLSSENRKKKYFQSIKTKASNYCMTELTSTHQLLKGEVCFKSDTAVSEQRFPGNLSVVANTECHLQGWNQALGWPALL